MTKRKKSPREQRAIIAKPGRGKRSRDWDLLKSRFLAYEWLTYTEMGQALGINPEQIKKAASKGEQTWLQERTENTRAAEEQARERVRARLAKEIDRRTGEALTMADLLRGKAAESLGQAEVLKRPDAIAAAAEARKIEETIIHRPTRAETEDLEDIDAPAEDGLIVIPAKRTAEGWKPSKARP